jgi:hypothetical protein
VQYPNIVCGHILTDLDAWLFAQINAGNVISLALNQGYGWAADVNLRFIFDRFFSVRQGQGYPAHRSEPQARSREILNTISRITHRSLTEIIDIMPEEILHPVLTYPGVKELIDTVHIEDEAIRKAFERRFSGL